MFMHFLDIEFTER